MLTCKVCTKPLENDEIALTKKLINRGATEFMCIDCLAEKFEATREQLQGKIEEFRKMGCTLFM